MVKLILDDDSDEDYSTQEERLFGIYFHQFMAEINDSSEMSEVLSRYQSNDAFDTSILLKMKDAAQLFFEIANNKGFFEESVKVYNEQSILINGANTLRPDKIIERRDDVIVVDFKTGSASPKHNEQVWNYKSVLEDVFDKPVKSILYYTQQNQLIEI